MLSAAVGAVSAAFAFATGPAQAHDIVSVKDSYTPGTIVIRTNERRLYYYVGTGEAIRYPVGVGRAGMQWSGTAFIDGKYIKPAWSAEAFGDLDEDVRQSARRIQASPFVTQHESLRGFVFDVATGRLNEVTL